MNVVIDTTVLGRDGLLVSSETNLLFSYLQRSGGRLYVPEIVAQEALNLVRKKLHEYNRTLRDLQRLTQDREQFELADVEAKLSEHQARLKKRFEELGVHILPIPPVSHAELVARALGSRRPFVEGGRGYRDALIWHTLLDFIRGSKERVVFISENSRDWAGNREGDCFHVDLVADLDEYQVSSDRLILLPTIARFNERFTLGAIAHAQPVAEGRDYPEPDYRHLLVDGAGFVDTQLASEIEHVLQKDYPELDVANVEILATSSPQDIQPAVPRFAGGERVLQFAARYRVALQHLARQTELQRWKQRYSLQVIEDWGAGFARILYVVPLKVQFRMVERGENTLSFDIVGLEFLEA